MLPKRKRVTKDLFQNIMKKGKVVSSPLFLFRYINQNSPQYVFVVPKTVSKRAVDRNKLRRQGYNILNSQALKPVAGIFFYKKEAKNANQTQIKEDILYFLNKIQ